MGRHVQHTRQLWGKHVLGGGGGQLMSSGEKCEKREEKRAEFERKRTKEKGYTENEEKKTVTKM